jgi:hypothetical protein
MVSDLCQRACICPLVKKFDFDYRVQFNPVRCRSLSVPFGVKHSDSPNTNSLMDDDFGSLVETGIGTGPLCDPRELQALSNLALPEIPTQLLWRWSPELGKNRQGE